MMMMMMIMMTMIMMVVVIGRYPSICNNAIWSLGELVLRAGQDMAVYTEVILPLLLSFNAQTRLPPGIKDNSTIAICRYCLMVPQAIGYVENYIGMLCTNVARLRYVNDDDDDNHHDNQVMDRDGDEKEQATKGLCTIIHARPDQLPNIFPAFMTMVASWYVRHLVLIDQFSPLGMQLAIWN